ncbi:hypothetical protein chiPu_0026308 [Chiloscyllium punctatum]|uniref:Uncharacterized protein n=1 Tax=Chiloscyllium punctatum TaxID=137246 RepID=A0A401THG7_CHIPU|nr:hypothetical protein [Chiloscyllium punctatum]
MDGGDRGEGGRSSRRPPRPLAGPPVRLRAGGRAPPRRLVGSDVRQGTALSEWRRGRLSLRPVPALSPGGWRLAAVGGSPPSSSPRFGGGGGGGGRERRWGRGQSRRAMEDGVTSEWPLLIDLFID